MKKLLLSAAVAGAFVAGGTSAALAESAPSGEKEKCYGVAEAGKNHCSSADGAHSCAGQAKTDNDPNEWKYVVKGECEGLGGSLTGPDKAEANSCEGKNSCEGHKGEAEDDHGHGHKHKHKGM